MNAKNETGNGHTEEVSLHLEVEAGSSADGSANQAFTAFNAGRR
jgi:hypothetical protein